MEIYIVDAFTGQRFGGNQAGVVLLAPEEPEPVPEWMAALAAELKHSETVFVRTMEENLFRLRYFTPTEEVALCGHATVAAFTLLRGLGRCGLGVCRAQTGAGLLDIQVEEKLVWLNMAPPRLLRSFTEAEVSAMYRAFGLEGQKSKIPAALVNSGLADILLPVESLETLNRAKMDREAVQILSERYDAVGCHVFSIGEGAAAHCRNCAPRVGIDEECATGTANTGLTFYLAQMGLLQPGAENRIVQGEAMGRPSEIYTRLGPDGKIQVGGSAVVSMCCRLWES